MNETIKVILLVSILLNIILVGLGLFILERRGGLAYLASKFLFLQNLKLRTKTMYDNPFYQDKKSHFETLPKSEAEVVFLGDSLTDLCEWAEFFANVRIKNRGICGDTTDGVLNRLGNIIESQPQKLFLLIGINDLNSNRQVTEVENNYRLILEKLKSGTPNTQVFIQSVLPVNYQKFKKNGVNDRVIALNAKLRELAEQHSFKYVDLFSHFIDKNNELATQYTLDGVHLNGQGYLLWQKIIEKDVIS